MHSATRDGLSELQQHPAVALVPLRRVWMGDIGRVLGVWEGGGKGARFVLDLALLMNEVGAAFQTLGNGRGKGSWLLGMELRAGIWVVRERSDASKCSVLEMG